MNWRLIFGLSLFGLAMALLTVALIPSTVEPIFWLAIFAICAFLIAKSRASGHFVHGLLVGIVNSVWVTSAHLIFFSAYMSNHAREAAMTQSMPLSPRAMMALIGPVVGIISGVIIGALAWIAGRFIHPASSAAVARQR